MEWDDVTGNLAQRIALYFLLGSLLYLIDAELDMWVVYLAIPIVIMIDRAGYKQGMTDGVGVILDSMTESEKHALTKKLTGIEEDLRDQK